MASEQSKAAQGGPESQRRDWKQPWWIEGQMSVVGYNCKGQIIGRYNFSRQRALKVEDQSQHVCPARLTPTKVRPGLPHVPVCT
jgi:hypothetical protein